MLCVTSTYAQKLTGIVKIQHETESPYLRGASITIRYGEKELKTQTDEKGRFIADLEDSSGQVYIDVLQDGYEVVNSEALVLNPAQAAEGTVYIFLAKTGEYAKQVQRYYSLAQQLVSRGMADTNLNRAYVPAERKRILEVVYREIGPISKRLARIERSQLSEMAQTAMEALEKADLSTALAALDDQKMADALKNSLQGTVRGEVYDAEAIELAREQSIFNYLLKARLSILNLNPKSAEAYYTRAVYEDQQSFDKMAEFSHFLLADEQLDKAGALCKKLASLTQNEWQDFVLNCMLAQMQLKQGQQNEAIKRLKHNYKAYFGMKVKLPAPYEDHLSWTFRELGKQYALHQQPDSALEVWKDATLLLEKATREFPQRYQNELAAHLKDLVELYQAQNMYKEALESCKRFNALYEGEKNSSLDAFRQYYLAQKLIADNYLYFGFADSARSLYLELEKMADQAAISDQERVGLLLELAKIHEQLFEPIKELVYLNKAEKLLSNVSIVHKEALQAILLMHKGVVFTRQYKLGMGQEYFLRFKQLADTAGLARALVSAGLEKMAENQLASRNYVALQASIKQLIPNENETALTKYARIPMGQNLLNLKAELYVAQNKFEKALEVLHILSTAYPESGDNLSFEQRQAMLRTFVNILRCSVRLGKWEEAQQALRQADILIDQYQPTTGLYIDWLNARTLFALYKGDYEKAKSWAYETIQKISAQQKEDPDILRGELLEASFYHIEALMRLDEYNAALAQLAAAQECWEGLYKDNPKVFIPEQAMIASLWADFYVYAQDYGKAEEQLFLSIDLLEEMNEKENSHFLVQLIEQYHQLAHLYVITQNREECLEALKKADQYNARFAGSSLLDQNQLLSYYWALARGMLKWGEYDIALDRLHVIAQIVEGLAEKEPAKYNQQLAEIYAYMAWCSLMQGEQVHAEAYIDASLVHETSDPAVEVKRAHVLLAVGRSAEAKKTYQYLLRQKIDGKSARDVCIDDFKAMEKVGIDQSLIKKAMNYLQ
ncbi:MAG: hypothetical protein D6730_13590 [Bacteroidetes bacterium]|nr:MAG: hypothetical protein D6730_13590 [Bacteroidota bacterium]